MCSQNQNSAQTLREILDNKKFVIPMYQRNYKWNTTVAEKLVKDIITCYRQSLENPKLEKQNSKSQKSLGLLTLYHDNPNDKTYYVIDGQQRFTTLSILLSVLDSETKINLSFERDRERCEKRRTAIWSNEKCCCECTDVNRIRRNKKAISDIIQKNVSLEEKSKIVEFVLENVIMLCSTVNTLPVEEFMNLNAYKTAFSISDHIRANLISLNSFHKEKMSREYAPILAQCLEQHTYKTAVAVLYNKIQEKLYESLPTEGTYRSIYELLKKPEKQVIDPGKESHINIIFGGMLKAGATNYESGEITENLDYWIKMLQKLAYVNKLLDELKSELGNGAFHSFKQIDDYQEMTGKSFIIEVFEKIRKLDEKWDSQTLAKEIQKFSNVDSILIRSLTPNSQKLANRYLEAFAYSTVNEETMKKADSKGKLSQMSMDEVIQEISGCGRYIVDRYEREHREDLDTVITIPPVIDLEDRENVDFGGSLDDPTIKDDTITVGNLFQYKICIPVIQRDYCMGARITGKNDFLAFLIQGFEDKKDLTASTILISVSKKDKKIYIFDGQQRTFTLYNILKWCKEKNLNEYSFIGRTGNSISGCESSYPKQVVDNQKKSSEDNSECGSSYSKQAVKDLNDTLEKNFHQNKEEFARYIKEKVRLKVKIVNDVSGAEQFFMDINGGVALKKYEIYKAMLCSCLADIGQEEMVRKIENEWLDFFYRFRKNYIGVGNIETDETDEEELLEIRFIEYVCRFVYRNMKKSKEVPMFDEIKSKGEIVETLQYINKLEEEDIEMVDQIMGKICNLEIDQTVKEQTAPFTLEKFEIPTNSSRKIVDACIIKCKLDEFDVSGNMAYYIARFIWSLSDKNREKIKNYYRYDKIESLRRIYDDDWIMDKILYYLIENNSGIDNTRCPYTDMRELELNLYGGYHNISYFNSGKFTRCSIPEHPEKEAPVYYLKDLPANEVLRLQYLYEHAKKDENNSPLHFALVQKGMNYEDGTPSLALQIKSSIVWEEEKITDNKSLYYIHMNGVAIWTGITIRSAYLFKFKALEYIEKYGEMTAKGTEESSENDEMKS